MRTLCCLCLAGALMAGEGVRPEPAAPGRDKAFLARILLESDGERPWRTYRTPEESGSAVVEVLGVFTPDEHRQMAFLEFTAWFRMDLKRFFKSHGLLAPNSSLAAATLPVDRFGGNPVPRNVPFARAGF